MTVPRENMKSSHTLPPYFSCRWPGNMMAALRYHRNLKTSLSSDHNPMRLCSVVLKNAALPSVHSFCWVVFSQFCDAQRRVGCDSSQTMLRSSVSSSFDISRSVVCVALSKGVPQWEHCKAVSMTRVKSNEGSCEALQLFAVTRYLVAPAKGCGRSRRRKSSPRLWASRFDQPAIKSPASNYRPHRQFMPSSVFGSLKNDNFSSRGGLGIHQPGSNTRGDRLGAMTAPSGRARDRAKCPAAARFNSSRAKT